MKARMVEALYQITGIGPTLNGRNGEGDRYYTDGEIHFARLVPDGRKTSAPPQVLAPPALVQFKDQLWACRRKNALPGACLYGPDMAQMTPHAILEDLLPLIDKYVAAYGAVAIFVVVYFESFGAPLPGETGVIAAGLLAARGDLSIVAVFLAVFCGAVLGDSHRLSDRPLRRAAAARAFRAVCEAHARAPRGVRGAVRAPGLLSGDDRALSARCCASSTA